MVVILYVLDSLRPDFLSCYGYEKQTSPHIDKIAQDGVIFTNAFAQSTWTRPSGASILSSMYPSVHRVMTVEDILSLFVPTLPEQLRRHGFMTIAISSMGNISPHFGLDRGFDCFIELYKENSVVKKRQNVETKSIGWQYHFNADSVAIPTSEDINDFLFPFIEKHRCRDIFAFIWSIDTHDPYFHRNPESPGLRCQTKEILWNKNICKITTERGRNYLRDLYEDMIHYNDYHIGALTERLKKYGLYDQTLLVITSDHGEAFGEHGFNSHAGIPYDEQARVPLIVKFPHSQFIGRIDGLVQHIDVTPTILDFLRIERSQLFFQGKSLLPLLCKQQDQVNHFVLSETQLDMDSRRYRSLRTMHYKYIKIEKPRFRLGKSFKGTLRNVRSLIENALIDREMLFSLREDPKEKNNIVSKEKGLLRSLRTQLDTVLSHNEKQFSHLKECHHHRKGLDERIKRQLRCLGYLE